MATRPFEADGTTLKPEHIASLLADGEAVTGSELRARIVAELNRLRPTFTDDKFHEPVSFSDTALVDAWLLQAVLTKDLIQFQGPSQYLYRRADQS